MFQIFVWENCYCKRSCPVLYIGMRTRAIFIARDERFLARLFYKNRRGIVTTWRQRQRRRLRPVKFWGKLLRQKIMSSFISSLAQNLFIFAVLIHMGVLIDNQALIKIHIYYFSHIFHVFGNVST